MTTLIKISQLPAATTPLSGAEVMTVVQGGVTKKVSSGAINDLIISPVAAAKTAAETAATNAANSAASAVASASLAATQVGQAQSAATESAASATNSAASATLAQNWATKTSSEVITGQGYGAKKYAQDAASSVAAISTSANQAVASAETATAQAAIATSQAESATASAASASSSASVASSSKDSALTYMNAAANSAATASNNAEIATTQAGIATTAAGTATAQAGISIVKAEDAASSASAAASARIAAESARDQTLAAFDSFDDRYLGAMESDPVTDNDGNALVAGALYFSTAGLGSMKVYTGSAWVAAYTSGSGYLVAANNLSDLISATAARSNLGLALVASTGAYADLSGTPTIPTTISSFTNDAGYATYPSQTGNTGKYLKTDGTDVSWSTVDALPSQAGNANKYLKTDGTVATWDTLNIGSSYLPISTRAGSSVNIGIANGNISVLNRAGASINVPTY